MVVHGIDYHLLRSSVDCGSEGSLLAEGKTVEECAGLCAVDPGKNELTKGMFLSLIINVRRFCTSVRIL